MTYALIVAPFVAATAVVVLLSARRDGFARRMTASAIAAGLFTYPDSLISGLRVGLAPIEDFAYPLCAAFLVPAVFVLLDRRAPPRREARS
jgi:hypothetical protein